MTEDTLVPNIILKADLKTDGKKVLQEKVRLLLKFKSSNSIPILPLNPHPCTQCSK